MSPLLLLSASYVFLAILVVWYCFGNKISGKGKIVVSLILPLVYFLHWMGLKQTEGWPSDQALPDIFEFLHADVVEPNELQQVKGSIYLWIRTEQNSPPRAYSLPYTRELHENVSGASQRRARGSSQVGSMGEGKIDRLKAIVSGIRSGRKLQIQNVPGSRLPQKKQRNVE